MVVVVGEKEVGEHAREDQGWDPARAELVEGEPVPGEGFGVGFGGEVGEVGEGEGVLECYSCRGD